MIGPPSACPGGSCPGVSAVPGASASSVLPGWSFRQPRWPATVFSAYSARLVGWDQGALPGFLLVGFPGPSRRTRHAPLSAPGAPRVVPAGAGRALGPAGVPTGSVCCRGGPVRHREQCPARAAGQRERPQARVRAGVISGAYGAEERPVRGRVRHPQQRPVQRPRPQWPPLPDRHRAGAAPLPVLAPGLAQHEVPQFSQGDRAERVPPVPGRPRRRRPPRPRPRHQGQVPGQRGDHVPDAGFRHERHQDDHPDHERPGQQPFPFPLHEPGAQRRPPRDPAGDAWPGLRFQPFLQRPQRRVMHRAALRPDLPVPLDLRFRDRDHLAEHDRAARADLYRAPDDQRGPVPAAQVPAALQRRRRQLQRHRDHHPRGNGHGTRRDGVRRRHVRLLQAKRSRQSFLVAGASPISQGTRSTGQQPAAITQRNQEQNQSSTVSP